MSSLAIEKILFYSRLSQACQHPVTLTHQNGLDIQLCCIDNPDVRKRIEKGKYFQLSHVPTLLISYSDGNMQIYEGPKVTQWMESQLYASQNPSGETRQQTPAYEEYEEYEDPAPRRRPKSKVLRKKQTRQEPVDEIEELQEEAAGVDMDYEDLSEPTSSVQSLPPVSVKDQKSQDVKDIAKKMMQQRESSLGYNEADLPFQS